MTHELNQFLHDRYGGYADKRQKQVRFGRIIAVDQHRDGRKINQSIHCMIFLKVYEDDALELTFSGNDPEDGAVRQLKAQLLRTKVTRSTPGALRQLATAYRAVRVPRDDRSWYFARREVASDLERLALELETFVRDMGR